MQPFFVMDGVEVYEEIGGGATSLVYHGRCTKILPFARPGDMVAVKLFRSMLHGIARERFEREVEIGIKITSPHLVKYHTCGIYEGQFGEHPFIVMEALSGSTLPTALEKLTTSGVKLREQFRDWFRAILKGMVALHQAGIIHRDIQPQNIMITEGGRVVILDYGASRVLTDALATATWEEIGTRRYWAPECLEENKDKWTPETDIFMLASCLLHLLTGVYILADAGNYPSFFKRLSSYNANTDPPEFKSLPSWVDAKVSGLLWQMLRPTPSHRPSSMEAFSVLAETPNPLPSILPGSPFPLSVFLWRIQQSSELSKVVSLASYRNHISHFVRLDRLLQIWSDAHVENRLESITKLVAWGLLRPVDPQQPVWFFNPSAEEPLLNETLEFEITSDAVAISQAVRENPNLATEVWGVRERISEYVKANRAGIRRYHGFNVAFIDSKYYVGDSSGENLLLVRLAIAHGSLPDQRLSSTPWTRLSVPQIGIGDELW